ncbi:MAG: hypothetical protein HWE25_07805 [Alphaproteobacteria bacterium]|nr:hypothetical protein [Alphaproteobacteria bacterium]
MNNFFLAASMASAFTALLHLFLGGREIAAPLLKARDMRAVAKYTNYYCWHMVSIVLATMAAGYGWSAFRPQSTEIAVLFSFLALAFCVWNVLLVFWKKQHPLHMPQWILFAGIFLLSVPGFF